MITFFAPAARCLAASSRFVNRPVPSKTTSTPSAFHGSSAGSLTDSTLKVVAIDRNAVGGRRDAGVKVSEHRVVLQQVSQGCGIGEIVHRHEIDVLVAERGAHDVAPDSPESVDADANGHESAPLRRAR